VFSKAKKAAKKLEYLAFRFDPTIEVKNPGARLPIMERVICVYEEELEVCLRATTGVNLYGFVFMTRRRSTFGEENAFMERELIDNPGYIIKSDYGLNQFLDMSRFPGQAQLTPSDVTARLAFALRSAKKLGVKILCVRHQKNTGAAVKGMPPQPESAATGFVHLNPYLADMQQFFAFSADAKGTWPPSNVREDHGRVKSEQTVSGANSVALFEGMTVRFGESKLVKDRYCGLEHEAMSKSLGIRSKKNYAKCHG
jgi:hypothetical protein